ncbi:hypothetical protein NM208_g6904 [Fusarium decemcellulare]|uniref:Uncharacterized protein n=1 Tax=Fusarium decemcellulare TaxID=57161 RepID=A0ACC1SB82_9HYPO|nr:hypothetical protein NM208_g6904 [Fusarium decemcellulare]
MTYVGRRTMYLWGGALTVAIFTAIGGIGVKLHTSSSSAMAWAIGSLIAVDSFVANLLVLPVTFVLVSEIPSSLLRSKSIVLARNFYSVVNILAGVMTPYMLNPTAWNWVPESKGRTTAEMDILFEQRVHVRKFKDIKVSLSQIEGDGLP